MTRGRTSGTIADSGGRIDLAGAGADTGSFSGTGGTVYLEGTLNNLGMSLALDDGSLTYVLNGAAIDGGIVASPTVQP